MDDLSANALRVLEARYLLRDREGRLIETPAGLFERVASAIAEAEGAGRASWAERFLDDVIEVNRYPLPEIERMTRRTRKIGLGVMGFAEALIRLGISYDSGDAERFAERLMHAVSTAAARASALLAQERGAFPAREGGAHGAMRNATRTAIAPTGTIGIIAGTSASIEPLFALAYRRRGVLGGETLEEVNPLLAELLERHGLDTRRVLAAVLARGRLADVPEVPEALRRLFVTALEIPAERHLAMQAAFQRRVDNAVSKTIRASRRGGARPLGETACPPGQEIVTAGVTASRRARRCRLSARRAADAA